jgi:hypothetical protein
MNFLTERVGYQSNKMELEFIQWVQNVDLKISPSITEFIPSDSTIICRLRMIFQSFREILDAAIEEADDRLDQGIEAVGSVEESVV